MKVILLRDVARIGKRYEVKEVPSGHALNFLIPRKLAEPATAENMKRIEALKEKQASTLALEAENFTVALARLKEIQVSVSAEANAQGHLFKAVHAEDIAAALSKHGLSVDVHQIDIPHPIKALGSHEVLLHSGAMKGSFMLEVTQK